METLYLKLYNKYTTLKKEKESQFDKLNHDQEVKFLNYVAAADEMIHYLKSDNDKLHEQVGALKNELASTRASSDEERAQVQKLLIYENQKNSELSEEILRLLNVEREECSCRTTSKEDGHGQKNLHNTTVETQGISPPRLTKIRKSIHISEATSVPHVDIELDHPSYQLVSMVQNNRAPSIQQPTCCLGKIYSSGGDSVDTSSFSCVFEYLVGLLVGLKVSPLVKSNTASILAHHQSSGYSFSLTWVDNSKGEVEVIYRVLSLGTLKNVAPEWMKETIVFGTSMCKAFLERISRVIRS